MAGANLTNSIKSFSPSVIIVGGGLAGSECAWQLALAGHKVVIIEQRPVSSTEAHKTDRLGELVCSNSLKSTDPLSAPGLLKDELTRMKSLILEAAMASQVPAGQALAVDRDAFAAYITSKIDKHPRIEVIRAEVKHYEELMITGAKGLIPVVLATGPLSGRSLMESLEPLVGKSLYFYDAIAPIIAGESINRDVAFLQNRHFKGQGGEVQKDEEGDYLNCPFSEEEYNNFISALKTAERVPSKDFEKLIYFQGCQPVEALLEKGDRTLAFGPMKPVGLSDPRTGNRPYAAIQLRKEDSEGRAWNMVGFQTKLKYPEQQRVFRLIPGLENAEFYRLGSLHRNTYVNSPTLLDAQFRLKTMPMLHFAGQVTGVEGYLESTAIGALVGRLLHLRFSGSIAEPPLPPATTALGALAHAIVFGKAKDFQPMNINWGLVPLDGIGERDHEKKEKLCSRARRQFGHWLSLFGF
ncbi:MAG TPA: methylenetetrahydrofolate--tRNA-(uracil(54)-C(5))-methyltransferase (FADH(2)-oxidizing) TrmFO [Bdellovibrionota bacterium]|jgi:methylenetetrahydrofolate--tRNA-(uracil-5-)-methyltransferase|nr:methylenetetrahydrofolate--tRNA-(uracil(54)-C(5))-methyltransferase (FADH(2)-oxidizing) TrmFO [Bdellovibrionota bacterium]